MTDFEQPIAAYLDREPMTVNDVSPPRCFTCDRPMTSQSELNRQIDWGWLVCDACMEQDIEDSCWCVYGWYLDGDPRQFEPDAENTPEEIERWRAACAAWELGVPIEPVPEEHGPWTDPATGTVTLGERPSPTAIGACHAPRAYGQGMSYCDQHPAAPDDWKGWPTETRSLVSGPLDEAGGGEER